MNNKNIIDSSDYNIYWNIIISDLKVKSLGGGYENKQSVNQHEDLDLIALALTDTLCRNNLLKN